MVTEIKEEVTEIDDSEALSWVKQDRGLFKTLDNTRHFMHINQNSIPVTFHTIDI